MRGSSTMKDVASSYEVGIAERRRLDLGADGVTL